LVKQQITANSIFFDIVQAVFYSFSARWITGKDLNQTYFKTAYLCKVKPSIEHTLDQVP
jgi:hypothetical protein